MALRLLGMFLADADDPQQVFKNTMASTFSRSGAKEIYSRILELLFNALIENDTDSLNNRLQSLNMGLVRFERQTFLKLLLLKVRLCSISYFSKSVNSGIFSR